MRHYKHLGIGMASAVLLVSVLGCSKPQRRQNAALAVTPVSGVAGCQANAAWIDQTTKIETDEPTDTKTPNDVFECGFYERSWEAFLLAMRPDPANQGKPAFLAYQTYASLFPGKVTQNFASGPLGLAVRTPEEAGPVFDGGIVQANSDIVVDQNGNPVLYSIEVDPIFAGFIDAQHLNDKAHLSDAATNPALPLGALEIKASWQVVDHPNYYGDYLVEDATIPQLMADPANPGKVKVNPNAKPRPVKVALLGIHIVYVLRNHPEMIWSTFEHVDGNGDFDLAPQAANLPEKISDRSKPVSSSAAFRLYWPGTPYGASNLIPPSLTLTGGKLSPATSVYRVFPWSQQVNPDDTADPMSEDPDVKSVNLNMAAVFSQNHISDSRSHYRLVGAVWLKTGAKRFNSAGTYALDDLAGETGLSNVSIESLTQPAVAPPGSDPALAEPNCLSCHIKAGGGALKGKSLGVSHLFKKFVSSN